MILNRPGTPRGGGSLKIEEISTTNFKDDTDSDDVKPEYEKIENKPVNKYHRAPTPTYSKTQEESPLEFKEEIEKQEKKEQQQIQQSKKESNDKTENAKAEDKNGNLKDKDLTAKDKPKSNKNGKEEDTIGKEDNL